MKVGDLVKLKAKTRHGENRIRQHGDIWTVMLISPSHMKGQIFLSSQEETFAVDDEASHDHRWVHLKNDKNFEIVEEK